jgi:CheY-like chemotaxis protein
MDISMPVMDGMTSTRLIREYEMDNNLTPSHIIALTGLTSASAKLEAWTSGVDDFLTKPVDFKKLEQLMEAGRGGEGTGFLKEQGS